MVQKDATLQKGKQQGPDQTAEASFRHVRLKTYDDNGNKENKIGKCSGRKKNLSISRLYGVLIQQHIQCCQNKMAPGSNSWLLSRFVVVVCLGLLRFQQFFSHITMMNVCDRELHANYYMYSATSLKYHASDT